MPLHDTRSSISAKRSQRLLEKSKSHKRKKRSDTREKPLHTARTSCGFCGQSIINPYALSVHIKILHNHTLGELSKYDEVVRKIAGKGYCCVKCEAIFTFKGDACQHFNEVCFIDLLREYKKEHKDEPEKDTKEHKKTFEKVNESAIALSRVTKKAAPLLVASREASSIVLPGWLKQDPEVFAQSIPATFRIFPAEAFKGLVFKCGGCGKLCSSEQACNNHIEECKSRRAIMAWQSYSNLVGILQCVKSAPCAKDNTDNADAMQILCPLCDKPHDDLKNYEKHAVEHRKNIQKSIIEKLTLYYQVCSKPYIEAKLEGEPIPSQVVVEKRTFETIV